MSLLRHMRRIVPLAAVVPALCLFSCVNMKDGGVAATSGPGSSTFTPEAIKASPLSVSVEGASDAPTRWNLFDGNTHTAFAPAEAASLRVDLPRNMKITRLRVYGKSSYDVRVYRIEGANRSASPALTIRGEGLSGSWNTITPPEPLSADALVFAFAPVGEPALGVREIEIWSGESGEIPDEGVCSTLDAVKTPERLAAAISHGYPHIHELSAAPAELSIAANGGREHPGTMSFALAMPPVQVRRAFLRFKGKNLCAAPSVERRINGLSWSGGFPVPCDASDEWKEYFEEINPAWLAAGTNTVDFCSARDVSIKELSVVLVTGSGWNWISGVSERNAFDFDTQTSAGVTIGHDMRIDFDSTVEPEHLLLHVPGPAHALARVQYLNNGSWRDIAGVWNVNCAGLVRGWNRLAFPAPVSADGIRLVFSAAPGGPAAPVEINEVRVAASPIAPRNAVRIVFDYPRNGEFFARSAYIRGFVATTAAISSLSLEGKTANADQTAPADGSFNVTLSKDETRYGAQKDDEPWDPALTALTGIGSFSSALHLYENRLSSSSGSGSGSGSGPGSGTDGDGEQSDGSYRATLYPDQSKTILFRDVTLKFPAGSVTKTTVIRIVPLSQGEIPKLGEGMINVTYPAAGYRFLPSGRFEKPVEVYFRYTKDAMKAGQKDEDVFMYYYDVADGKWKRLERLAVEPAITMVTSQTDHFTDIINATLVVPEHPDPLSYNPNSIKDIKAGDPGAGINLIEPPTANSNGDVALSYPIDIPRGRNGMQPQIAVRYNSSGGNGWMGLGWDIPIQSVVIDTKFGVPRYNGSETYLLEGASIVPIGNNQYRQRTEGPFKRILRRGDAPTNFYWEVTDKNGTRFIYGQSAGSRLAASDGGNIFQWCLERVVDTNGNTIVYDYDADNSSLHGLPWRQLYLSRISYTGYGGTAGPYTVEFNRDGGVRKDRIVTCRGGFKITTRYLLSSIDVKYNGSTIRRYGFVYEPGPFFKTLLKEIIQYGEGGSGEFHRHGFTYNNDVDALAGQDFSGFHENELSWGDGSPGRNESESGSANLYLGITPCFLKEKDSSIGVKMGRSYNSSRPREMLIDLDGDGLPDYVYDKGRRYNTNRSSPERDPGQWYTFGGGDVEGLNELGKESGTSNTFGVQMFLFGLGVFNDRNWGTSKGDGYFTDVNGDGLVDYVNGTTVHFNHGADGSGKVVFRNHPPVSFGGGTADIREDDLGSRPYTKEQLDAKYNREDPIRMWQAPYSGTVRVSGPVRLVEKPGTPEAGEYVTNDGVRVSIQKGSSLLWSSAIEKDNHASLAPSVSEIPVNEGERIYFRVNSVDDGSYDAVEWSPVVEYVGAGVDPALLDENGRPAYVFNSAEDFSIAGTDGSWSAPEDGTADFSWTINKEQTSDDVMVQVIKNGEVLMSRHLGWDEIGTFTLSETVSLRGKQDGSGGFPGDTIECRIIADTPIDWTAIRVTAAPTVTYTERNNGYPAYDKNGNPTIVVNIPVYENLFPVRGVEGFPNDPVLPFVSSKTMRARVYFPLQILSVPTGDEEVGVTFAVKRANGLVVKQRYSITKDTIPFGALALDYTIEDLSAGDALYFVVVFDRHDVFEKGYFQIGIPQVYYEDENFPDPDGHIGMGTGHPALYASAIYRPADTPHPFAGGYRNWHYGRWNGERDTLDPALMKLPADGDAQDLAGLMNQYQADPTNEQLKQQIADKTNALNEAYKIFGPMSLDRESGRWRGFDGNDKNPLGDCWISASGMSSTRVVQRYNPVSDTVHMGIVGPGSGSGRGVRKFTRTSENALGASIMASLQESNGTSDTFTEFFDLNGDRYPDVITSDGIQYTGHDGTLGGREGSFAGSVRHNETHNYGASIAIPSEVPYIFKVLVGADGTPKGQAPDGNMTVGISFNTSWGETVTTADFLDVNGDGLPDRVDNGVVYLNTGYGFVYDGDFGLVEGGVRLTKTANLGDGFNIGYAKNLMSFGGGLSGSTSLAAVEYDYIDINGDGLPDLVKMETEQKPAGLAWELVSMITGGASAEKIDWTRGEEMEVWINTGSDFDGPYKWLGANTHLPVSLDASYSMSIPLAFTKKIEVPLPVCPFELIINPSGSGSMQEGASLVRIMDMDGDGYPDQVFADSSGRVVTRMNKTGKTNLLSEVRRPLGGSFAIEYKRQGNTAVMPQSRWTMSRVTLRDGSPDAEGAHTYVSDFRYSNGYYDRTEREFHGFWRVEEIKRGGGAGDVTHTRYYHAGNLTGIGRGNTTENFYRKGLEYASSVRNASGALFQTTDSEFSLHELVAEKAYFPRLTQKSYCYYEGGATCQKSTRQTYEYDQYGNVSKFTDHGEDDDPADDLTAVIAYSYSPDSHIVAKPKLMTVTG
ncbi:MAG TPA: SpvB/TcaC N-terminal domain-containing protein, partial [Spirochaetota bacterium]|nr:SpvB/TcaC N-terminal domain-containing protein [Spirochaetota bacterium]HNT13008.1 SpvB/TcaC N-terminal domain-containing protein [Spirochaetota bacterium]